MINRYTRSVILRYALVNVVLIASAYISPWLVIGISVGMAIRASHRFDQAIRKANDHMVHPRLVSGRVLIAIFLISIPLLLLALWNTLGAFTAQ